jgi:cytochrome c-type biogenesis protein
MSILAIPVAALAGGLTILSPCILPIAPVVLSSALTQHKWGALALSLGLGLSFAFVGVCLALLETAFNFDADIVKQGGALLMFALGLLMLAPKRFDVFAIAGGSVSQWANKAADSFDGNGILGQFGVGMLLALIWSPCVGPTLGTAFALAATGESLVIVAMTMMFFAFGASATLLGLSVMIRSTVSLNKKVLSSLAKHGRTLFAASIILVALLSLSGFDQVLGAAIVAASPDWVVGLVTRF